MTNYYDGILGSSLILKFSYYFMYQLLVNVKADHDI